MKNNILYISDTNLIFLTEKDINNVNILIAKYFFNQKVVGLIDTKETVMTEGLGFNDIPKYTDYIDLAWTIAEKLNLMIFPRNNRIGWCAVSHDNTLANKMGRGYLNFDADDAVKASTASLAICVYALKKIGIDFKGEELMKKET
jgi:hypothetical protein